MQDRDFKGVWIPKALWLDKSLNPMQKFFLLEIDSLCGKRGCFASNAHFAELFGLSKRQCSRIINELLDMKLITVAIKLEGKQVKERVIRIAYPIDKNVHTPIDKNVLYPIDKNGAGNNTNKAIIPKDIVGKPDFTAEREKIITYLNLKTGARFRPDSKNAKKYVDKNLLSGVALEDFFSVIESKSAEWNGTKFQKFLRPETLFGSKFDTYLATAHIKPIHDETPDEAMRKLQEQQHGFNASTDNSGFPLLGVSDSVGKQVQGGNGTDGEVAHQVGADIVWIHSGSCG